MTPLEAAAKVAMANVFVMYFKSHSYHWNVEGKNFPQYHSFLGDLYEELHGSIDPLAEHIRTLDVYACFSVDDLYTYKTIGEDAAKPATAEQMFANLLVANGEVIDSLNTVFKLATANNKQGFANFVADRIDTHEKHGWMIRSLIKFGE